MPTVAPTAPSAAFVWDTDRYEDAVEKGIFTPDDPIELIDGEIITHMSPQRSPHSATVSLIADALRVAFGRGFYVREQQPIRLGARSMPEPDVAVVRGSAADYFETHPRAAEIIVEVADTSLSIDRGRKLRLYAREGVPEYWIVNLGEHCVEVCRQPASEDYAELRTYRRGDTISAGPTGQPVSVSDFLR